MKIEQFKHENVREDGVTLVNGEEADKKCLFYG